MKRRVRFLAIATFACLTTVLAAQSRLDADREPIVRKKAEQPQRPDREGPLRERIRMELRRRGLHGAQDAETLLQRTREYMRESDGHERHINAITGSAWTSIGPANGSGRITAIAPHPTVGGTVLAGAAGGGVWKTTDSGAHWTALTDGIPNLSVGALGWSTSNTQIIYLGTGEGGDGGDMIPGIGLLASPDGGGTWTLPSSVLATQFYRISVNPSNANDLVVATNAGLFRSTTGQNGFGSPLIPFSSSGATLGYHDVTDLVRDPSNASILYATTWDVFAWCAKFGCSDPNNVKSSRVLKSIDDGATWNEVMTNLPVSTATLQVGRMSIAIAPSSPSTLYVAFTTYDSNLQTTTAHIYKTTNGGASWTETNLSAEGPGVSDYFAYYDQSWYDNVLVVSPTDPNSVMAGGVSYVKSIDGGTTWTQAINTTASNGAHVDVHALNYDKAGTLYLGNDGGVWTTTDFGTNTTDRNTGLVTRQFYTIVNDRANRNRVFGGTQDNGSERRTDAGGTSWDITLGGDGFGVAINFDAPSLAFNSLYNGRVFRTFNAGAATPVMQPHQPLWQTSIESPPFDTKVVMDPTNPKTLYTTSHRAWKSTDSGITWLPLPTTTTDGSTWPPTYTSISALSIAPTSPQTLMAGINGKVFRSTNGGQSWILASTGLPSKGINALEIDPHNPLVAYVGFAGLAPPNLYVTSNGGASWTASASGLPSFSVQVIKVDPTDSSNIYCGTDVGVYRSTSSGTSWSAFGTGLPAVGVWDIDILRDGTIVRAGTHGRGAWELTVTSPSNAAPTVSVTSPVAPAPVVRGTPLTFTGTFSDANGDPVTAFWIFPDDGTAQSAVSATSITHTFSRAGRFPVTLNVKDSHGGVGAASVDVTVLDSADACATPVVIPATGPFPYTVAADTSGSTKQVTDPATMGSCAPYSYGSSVWYSFTPTSSGTYTLSLCGSNMSAVINLYTGTACGPYTEIGSCTYGYGANGDASDFDCSSPNTARVVATLSGGTTYRIKVNEYFTEDYGPVYLTVTTGTNTIPPLAVMAVGPATGTTSGGTPITITGYNFDMSTTVTIGGAAATSVALVTPNLLTAVTPPGALGDADVVVTRSTTSATVKAGFTYVNPIIAAPTGVVAAATTASNVHISWNAVAGAVTYQIFRSSGGIYVPVGTSLATSYDDGAVSAGNSYLYKVHTVGSASTSGDSNIDYATTVIFSDDALVAGSTVVKAVHLAELRTAVNALLALAGQTPMTFTDSASAGVIIQAVHLSELRTGLNTALTHLGRSALTFTNPGTSGTLVSAADFQEIRNALK